MDRSSGGKGGRSWPGARNENEREGEAGDDRRAAAGDCPGPLGSRRAGRSRLRGDPAPCLRPLSAIFARSAPSMRRWSACCAHASDQSRRTRNGCPPSISRIRRSCACSIQACVKFAFALSATPLMPLGARETFMTRGRHASGGARAAESSKDERGCRGPARRARKWR